MAFKRSIPMQNGVGPGLAFICNQQSKYVVGVLAPSPGTFKNEQESISLAIQKSEDGYDPSDLLQRWENEGEYIFSEIPGEQEDLTSYLKDRESEGVTSVHYNGGKVYFEGRDITRMAPRKITKLGIARAFQIPQLFLEQTVIENLLLAITSRRNGWSSLRALG